MNKKTDMLTISFIIPVYKVEPYIEECLKSVVAQNTQLARVECIVVDDCSPDKSMDVVSSFVESYHGDVTFRLLRHEKNRGLSAARNTGIDAATGDYVYFLDSDDYLLDDCLKTLLSGFSYCPDADVIQTDYVKGEGTSIYNVKPPYVLKDRKEILSALVRLDIPVIACTKLVRRKLIVERKIYFTEGLLFEDNPWSYKLMGEASRLVVLPQKTYYYRYVETSIMNSRQRNLMRMIESWDAIMTIVLGWHDNVKGSLLVFLYSRLLEIQDMMSAPECDEKTRHAARRLRTRVLREMVRYVRPLLLLWSLTLFRPFNFIYSFRFVRSHYFVIEKVLVRMELAVDRLFWHSRIPD